MPPMRTKRSVEEFRSVWKHLVYEIEMLNGTGQVLSTLKVDPESDRDRITQNALIESFTVHARSLVAFLYPETPKPDDVIADDFFDDPSAWHAKRPPLTDLLKTVHPRVGKEVAHLTYVRIDITPEQRQWSFVQVATEIDLALRVFAGLLPADFIRPPAPNPLSTARGLSSTITEVGSKALRELDVP